MIYLASGLSKLQGSAWWSGTALWQTLTNYEFAGPHGALGTAGLRFLAEHRRLWELALSGGVAFLHALENSLPYLVSPPRRRWPLLLGSVLLHTGIALSMGWLWTFSLAMLAMAAAFLPPEALHRLLAWAGRQLAKARPARGREDVRRAGALV